MTLIEVDHDVSTKLTDAAKQLGITRNGILRKLLKLDNPAISSIMAEMPQMNTKSGSNHFSHNIQDELIPYIVKILYANGGRAPKITVENEIYTLFQPEFEKRYYNETVSHGVPRWKHCVAWAKERARQRHGFVKSASESGRGIWELTEAGIAHYEHTL